MTKRALFFLPALLFFSHAIGQWFPPWPRFLPYRHLPSRSFPPGILDRRRWLISFNAPGLLEGAAGLGVGYSLDKNTELWSETSVLFGSLFGVAGPITGFRQIVQYKRFLPSIGDNCFLALEMRYKSYSYRDTNDFANPATFDTLRNVSFLSVHHVFGAALQIGRRVAMGKSERFQLEFMIGIGYKYKVIDRKGPPPGYLYQDKGKSTDLNIRDLIETPGSTFYLPGSVRVIYFFGKKLK